MGENGVTSEETQQKTNTLGAGKSRILENSDSVSVFFFNSVKIF